MKGKRYPKEFKEQIINEAMEIGNVAQEPIEMPHYGRKTCSPKTLFSWLNDYRHGGLDNLKPGYRSDRGKSRKVTDKVALKIKEIRAVHPRITTIMLYERLVKDRVITPSDISRATFYRFLAANPELAAGKDPDDPTEKELKRFSHQWI